MMKKPYEEPTIVIEYFPGQDIITFSIGETGGDEGDDETIDMG